MTSRRAVLRGLLLGSAAAMVAGCGGGGGDGATDSAPQDTDNDSAAFGLKGTAAIGKAIPDAPVEVLYGAAGVLRGRTKADGTYRIDLEPDAFSPLLIKVTQADGTALYSVAFESDDDRFVTANVTPLTNLLVNYLMSIPSAGGEAGANTPEAWFRSELGQSVLQDSDDPDDADGDTIKTYVEGEFIPLLKELVPDLSFNDLSFLNVAFAAESASGTAGTRDNGKSAQNATIQASPADDDLIKARRAGAVDEKGQPKENAKNKMKAKKPKKPKKCKKKNKNKNKPGKKKNKHCPPATGAGG